MRNLFVIGCCLIAFTVLAGDDPIPMSRMHGPDGEPAPIVVEMERSVSIARMDEELVRRGYLDHPYQLVTGRAPQIDPVRAGVPPETDCPVEGLCTPDGNYVIFLNRLSNNVTAMNLSTYQWEYSASVGEMPLGMAITPSGGHLLVSSVLDNRVDVINLTTWAVDYTIPVGQEPAGIAVAPDGSRAAVMDTLDDTVSVIDLNSWTVVHKVPGV